MFLQLLQERFFSSIATTRYTGTGFFFSYAGYKTLAAFNLLDYNGIIGGAGGCTSVN
jgi:hypothetical protein